MYLVNVIIFNEIHLRRKNERLGWKLLYIYYLPYKIVLTVINVASCYWSVPQVSPKNSSLLTTLRSLWKYARYFAKRHPKVVEDEKAIEVIIRLEEEEEAASASTGHGVGRRMTVRTIATTRSPGPARNNSAVSPLQRIDTGAYRVVMEPEPAHLKPESALQREHIDATDYFFGAHGSDHQLGTTDLESGNMRQKAGVES
jgi:hypothetical protein